MKYIFLSIYILILLCKGSIQDLPVHCLVGKIEGDWVIHMGDNYSDKDLKCGHKTPDQNLDHYDVDVEKVFKQKHEVIIHLERPNKVISVIDRKTEIGKWTMIYDEGVEFTIHNQVFFAFSRYKKVGKFSPSNTDTEDTPGYKNICDKTFIGWYHNKNTNENWGCYWAEKINKNDLSKYNLKAIDYRNLFKLKSVPKGGVNEHNSHNGALDEGEVNNQSEDIDNESPINNLKKNFIKKNNKNGDLFSLMNELAEKPEDNLNHNHSNLSKNKTQQKQSKQNKPSLPAKPKQMENGPLKSDYTYMDFVKSLGWDSNNGSQSNVPHLDIYFLNNKEENQESGFLEVESSTKFFTPDYGYINKVNNPKNGFLWKAKVYDDFVGKSYSQMRTLLGNVNFFKTMPMKEDSISDSESSYLELEFKLSEHEQSESSSKSLFLNEKLPEVFDWRNVDGTNYDSPIRKQGECGSCYAIAAASVLEARIRIKTNNRMKPILSPSSIISCSRYNQGCAGGYPYLVGKFGKEFGFVEESCQPYSETDDKCYNYCFHQKKWGVKDYGYVGGYYGGCDEESMMREIYENGPIVVAINATPELYYYSSGIFHSEAKKTEGKLEKNVKPWEYTNHAVVCVGWGEEIVNDNIVKFWILKNSWGAQWGEKGYFRINRGTNMASVEAQGVYLSPDI